MDEKELKELTDSIKNKAQEAFDNFKKEVISRGDFDARMVEIQNELLLLKENKAVEDLTKIVNDLKEQSTNQGVEITKLNQFAIGGKAHEPQKLENIISQALKEDEIKDFMKKKKSTTNQVDLKLVGDMTEAGNLTAGSILITDQPRRDIIELKTRPIHMREIIPVGTTEKDRIPVVKQANYEDGADMKAENTSSTESDFDLVETYVNVERMATHLIVSKDLLDDVSALTSFISNHLPKRMMTKEDQQILFGSGSTPQIQGITGVASAFAAGVFATSIPAANEIDVLRVSLSNLNVGYYSPSAIMLHPEDCAKIDTLKTASTREYLGNNYLVSRDANTGIMRIAGIPIIQSTAMTTGYFCIGDFADAVELVDRKKLTMQMSDSHSDYFIKNMVCISFEERLALPIYYNGAFVYGQFSVAKAAITSGS
jgi:HK97 family phage major capsid protein